MITRLITVFCLIFIVTAFTNAQQPYYSRVDSVGAAAVVGQTDSTAYFTLGKLVYSLQITVTNSTTGDTLKAKGIWYGNSTAKTVSWRNTKTGNIDSVLVIAATAGIPHTWELLDPNINSLEIYSSAGTYVATRKNKIYFKYRK